MAVMRQFNGDIIEAVSWFFSLLSDLAGRVADKFSEMPRFRDMFS